MLLDEQDRESKPPPGCALWNRTSSFAVPVNTI